MVFYCLLADGSRRIPLISKTPANFQPAERPHLIIDRRRVAETVSIPLSTVAERPRYPDDR